MDPALSYRQSSIGGASTIGLMLALFDTLAGDIRRAATAIRQRDIEARCRDLNHAILVIGQLESWIDLEKGGQPALHLTQFYSYLRAKILEASVTQSAVVLDAQIEMILHVRTAWQKFEGSSQRSSAYQDQIREGDSTEATVLSSEQPEPRTPLSFSA